MLCVLFLILPADPNMVAHSCGHAAHHTVPHLCNTVSLLQTDVSVLTEATVCFCKRLLKQSRKSSIATRWWISFVPDEFVCRGKSSYSEMHMFVGTKEKFRSCTLSTLVMHLFSSYVLVKQPVISYNDNNPAPSYTSTFQQLRSSDQNLLPSTTTNNSIIGNVSPMCLSLHRCAEMCPLLFMFVGKVNWFQKFRSLDCQVDTFSSLTLRTWTLLQACLSAWFEYDWVAAILLNTLLPCQHSSRQLLRTSQAGGNVASAEDWSWLFDSYQSKPRN